MQTESKNVGMDIENETFILKSDSSELCRLCANTDNQLIPIFKGEGIEHNIPNKIEQHLPIIKVTELDKLPLQICYQCASTLIAWHNLYEGSKIADKRLREVLCIDEKLCQNEETYENYDDDFHDDYDDQSSNNFLENIQLNSASTSSQPEDLQQNVTSEVNELNDEKTSDETENNNPSDERNAVFVDEKWDPLTIIPQPCSTFSEDRAKLVKSKKLGPHVKTEKGNTMTVLECGQCTAFFIDRGDFEKHKLSHGDGDVDVDVKDYESAGSNGSESSRLRSRRKCAHFESRACARWRSVPQKLRNKMGGNAGGATKKTARKIGRPRKNDECSDTESSQRRRSVRISYEEYDDSDIEDKIVFEKSKNVARGTESDAYDFQPQSTKKRKELKRKRRVSRETTTVIISEIDQDGNEIESCDMKTRSKRPRAEDKEALLGDDGRLIDEFERFEQKPARHDLVRTESMMKKRKPRSKRLRRYVDEDDDKSQTIYTCAHCLRNFRRKSNLKRHMSKLHCGKEKEDGADSSKWFTGYCCDMCGEGLQVRSAMLAHRDVVHGSFPEIDWCKYQTSLARVKFCGACKKYFRAGKLFDEHKCDKGAGIVDGERARLMKEAENVRPAFACHICNSCFRWKWDYRLHRESEHKDAEPMDWPSVKAMHLEFFCEKCFKAYPTDEDLKAHCCSAAPPPSSSEAVVKPFRCDICGNDYFWKSDFRRHMRTKHPKENYRPTEHDTIIYSCPYCNEKFSMKKRILHHMRKAHNITTDSPFVCVQCNKVFRRRDNLDRHNESYHPSVNDADEANGILKSAEIRINGEVAYHCQTCNRNIANPNRFISHYRGHYSESKFTCDLCGKQAKTQHQLNTHIKNIHLNIRNYKCDICDKSFYTKQACEEHRRIHTGERPFSCEICGKTFVAGNALISHKRFHNDFYPHSCHMCPKKFKVRRSLINHIRTHTGERPFKCDLCTKTFNNSSQYSYHKKVTHSEERPFTCMLCGNCFKANKFLSRHMELHTVRSQIQSRKPHNPAHYVTSQMKTAPESGVPAQQQQQRVSIVEQAGSAVAAPLMQAPQPVMDTTSSNYMKEVTPSVYRNDDIVAAALYNLQRGYESAGNDFARPNDCDLNAVKRTFTAAEAYMAAANYALTPDEDYKTQIARTYNTNQLTASNQPMVSGKHMTWL